MAKIPKHIGFEEKGKKAERSTDVYLPKGGAATFCEQCKAVYRNKRWSMEPPGPGSSGKGARKTGGVCPACQRIRDANPAGVLTLSGAYFLEHENDILNMIKHLEANTRDKNPLARIMEISQEKDVLTIATTDAKLAQKLGKEIYKAHKGELNFQWSQAETFSRVNWNR